MGRGQFNLGKTIIANSFLHDNSKFFGFEYDCLSESAPNDHDLKIAVMQHNRTNRHHPEFYDLGIKGMPIEYLGEMICDWKARSAERGTSLMAWVENEAMKRYHFTTEDDVYAVITDFVGLLIEPPLRNVAEF